MSKSEETSPDGRYAKVQMWLNPLVFFASVDSDGKPTDRDLIEYFVTPGSSATNASLAERYDKISSSQANLGYLPGEQRVLNKLAWPLRHAIGSYMTGNLYGTISLCGMVAEMIAVLMFDLAEIQDRNGSILSKSQQQMLFGSAFEKLGQDRRVKVLKAYGLIGDEVVSEFDTIRITRRRYLHLWSQDGNTIDEEAIACYRAAVTLVGRVFDHGVVDGVIQVDPRVARYLERHNMLGDRCHEPPWSHVERPEKD